MPPRPEHTVYILANRKPTVFGACPGLRSGGGGTDDIARRKREHRSADGTGLVHKYNLHALVYTETHADPRDAVVCEKRLKRWRID